MKIVRIIIKVLVVLLVVAFICIQFKHPAKTNPTYNAADSLQAHVQVPPQVTAILNRACADCHSNQTRWPWYSNVAPVSWSVIDHVDHGRKHLNFSEWTKPSPHSPGATAQDHLEDICNVVKKGAMPLSSYTFIHRDAILSNDDIKALCDWANVERERLTKAESESTNSIANSTKR